MTAKPVNPRKKKLDAICTKIARFAMQETFVDEQEAQHELAKAIECLDKAAALLVKSDEQAQPTKLSVERE